MRAEGVGVVPEAERACMSVPGVRAGDARTLTSAIGEPGWTASQSNSWASGVKAMPWASATGL